MQFKTTARSSLILALSWSFSAAGAPLDQRSLIDKACRAPAEQQRASAERRAIAAERRAAGAFPNPRLEAQHLRTLEGPEDRETIVGVAVPLVLSGRLGLLGEAAAARARELDAQSRARRFEAVLEAQRLFARAVVAEAASDVLARQQAALEELAAAAASLVRSGETARHDALRQAFEARVHRQTLARARAAAAGTKQALEAWLGERVALPSLDQSGLRQAAARSRTGGEVPSLAALAASAEASGLEARAARRRAVPDPEIFAGYRQIDVEGESGRGIALGLSVPLPLFDRGQAEAQRAEASAERTRADLSYERRKLEAAAGAERARLEVLQHELGRVDQDVRDAAELRQGARKRYLAGEGSVTELLDAYRAAELTELARLELIEDIALARIELARATGDPARACEGPRR